MRSQQAMERMNVELHQLKVDLATSNESRENIDLKIKLQHLPDAKTVLETNILRLEWKKRCSCVECVWGAEKATADERLKELID